MPRFYCDYCDAYLTHDSWSVRKQHFSGYRHKSNVKSYYLMFEPEYQVQLDAEVQGLAPPPEAATPYPAGSNVQGPVPQHHYTEPGPGHQQQHPPGPARPPGPYGQPPPTQPMHPLPQGRGGYRPGMPMPYQQPHPHPTQGPVQFSRQPAPRSGPQQGPYYGPGRGMGPRPPYPSPPPQQQPYPSRPGGDRGPPGYGGAPGPYQRDSRRYGYESRPH